MKSTQLSLVLVGLHDFQIFPDRTAHAWSVEVGNICSVSVFFVRVGSQISPRRAKKDSNIPFPGRTRSVKCPTPGPTKTMKSPPHALPPPSPPAGITLIGAFLSGHHRQCDPTFFLPYFLWSRQLYIIALWRFYCKSRQTFGHYTQQSQDVRLWREEWGGSPTGLKNCSLTQESFII